MNSKQILKMKQMRKKLFDLLISHIVDQIILKNNSSLIKLQFETLPDFKIN